MFIAVELLQVAVVNPFAGTGFEILHSLESCSVFTKSFGTLDSEMVALNSDGINGLGVAGPNLKMVEENIEKRPWPDLPQQLEMVLNQGQVVYPQSDDVFGSEPSLTDSRSRHQTDPD